MISFTTYASDMNSGVLVPSEVDSDIVRQIDLKDPDFYIRGLISRNPYDYFRSLGPQSSEYGRLLVEKYKLMHGYYPKKLKWTFGFYTTHSIGFFIKRQAQLNLGFYDTQYKYSADYDLFYRMIVKKSFKGISTKKNEIIQIFFKRIYYFMPYSIIRS